MHADEIRATAAQVQALVADQRPDWAQLPVTQLASDLEGTDHVLFRLGDDLLVRMPKIGWAVEQADHDATWLPVLAPHLPARVPVPLHLGRPGHGFPWAWSVVPWIDGTTPDRMGTDDPRLAHDLAAFTTALHSIDAAGAPRKAPGTRGAPLRHGDDAARSAFRRLAHHDDGFALAAAEAAWEDCASAPEWAHAPVWIHGDLQPGNLVTDHDGRLTGVIDFGGLGAGDPAPDLAAAFWTFTGTARAAYRDALGLDHDTWRRARGWALLPSLTGIDYYRTTFPRMAEHGRRMVRAVIADLESE